MKKATLDELLKGKKFNTYEDEVDYIFKLINDKKIKPIKKSSKNGKKPALHLGYWVLDEKKDYSSLYDELRNLISSKIQIDYYLNNPSVYENERKLVIQLSDYLENEQDKLNVLMSENERSFDIWKHEKFLSGVSIDGISSTNLLKHCGINREFLNTYKTAEPLTYFTNHNKCPQNILISENLDPFYSIRKLLIENESSMIANVYIGTLIYGGGKRIFKNMEDFDISAEPYMKDTGNTILYVGDLDYEGISIYESLKEKNVNKIEIQICLEIYNLMIEKAMKIETKLPKAKDQNVIDISGFLRNFDDDKSAFLNKILKEGFYVPQEILNQADYIL